MRLIIFSIIIYLTFGCAQKTELPKANIVKETERVIEKTEKSLASEDFDLKELIETSINLSIATNIPDLKIRAYLLKTNYEIRTGSFDNAQKNLDTAREISIRESPNMIPYIKYYEILIAYITQNTNLLNSLLKEDINYPEEVLTGINIIKSLNHLKNNNLTLAKNFAKDSLKISNKKNLLIEKSFTLKILSLIDLKDKNIKGAISLIDEALHIDRSLNLLDYIYWDLEFLGNIYLMESQQDKALYYYKSAYELALTNKNSSKIKHFKSKIDNVLK
ncbi:MAG: hypothetical protein N2202_00110 [Proteobacteria bacterium]|nr:hypothetical protein [Pseudomonadota bacterium]